MTALVSLLKVWSLQKGDPMGRFDAEAQIRAGVRPETVHKFQYGESAGKLYPANAAL
jgi:hypothetical protein